MIRSCFAALVFFLAPLEWNGEKVDHSDPEWQELLGAERFQIMRQKGTEHAFVGKFAYPRNKTSGLYLCSACSLPLFDAADQYDAGGGYPCFTKAVASKNLYFTEDFALPFKRYEIICRKCDSHLGHVFHDGPPPKHLRFCINSLALILQEM